MTRAFLPLLVLASLLGGCVTAGVAKRNADFALQRRDEQTARLTMPRPGPRDAGAFRR
jgi:hypothetical protein